MSFKDQLQTDLDVFVNPDEFGDAATLSIGGVDTQINVLVSTEPDQSGVFDALVTLLQLKRTDAPGLDKTAIFIVEGKRYGVLNIPDDYAITLIPTIVVSEVG